jgi:hypothetical protein
VSSERDTGACGPGRADANTLSAERIVEVADATARENGRDPGEERVTVFYDEGNANWKYHVAMNRKMAALERDEGHEERLLKRARRLEGRDFQAVRYTYAYPRLGSDLWVLVDRNTGEVLWVTHDP